MICKTKVNILEQRPSPTTRSTYPLVGHVWTWPVKGMFIQAVVDLGDRSNGGVQRIGRRRTRTYDPWVEVLMGEVTVVSLECSGHGKAVEEMMGT